MKQIKIFDVNIKNNISITFCFIYYFINRVIDKKIIESYKSTQNFKPETILNF